MKHGDCRHFNGIQNKVCKAGVNYHGLTDRDGQIAFVLPCLGPNPHAKAPAAECGLFEAVTQADLDARRAQIDAAMERHRKVGEALGAAISLQRKQSKSSRTSKRVSYDCPVCGKAGALAVSTSGYNGHAHGRCSTAGCVSWQE